MRIQPKGLFVSLCLVAAACSPAEEEAKNPCEGVSGNCIALEEGVSESEVVKAFVGAKKGDTIAFGEGVFRFKKSLSLDAEGVTIQGQGMNKSILSFKGQSSGAEGIHVTGSDFTIQDLAIEDTAGDALKIEGVNGVYIRRVRTEWTGGPKETNGAYGLYPVQCENVLIEGSVAIGASDAGIYVGQSKNIIVRDSRAEYNVAGIEIENSLNADVHDNVATNNTGGILVFSLPGLELKHAQNVRVFNNEVYENNTNNFAPEGNIVGNVPTGTGMMVMAASKVEVFDNKIRDNDALGLLIVSYLAADRPIEDPTYYPYPETVYVHDNEFIGGGANPGGTAEFADKRPGDRAAMLLVGSLGNPSEMPDIAWDGYMNKPTATTDAGVMKPELNICIQNNGDAGFVNFDYEHDASDPSYDLKPHDCTHPAVKAVTGVE